MIINNNIIREKMIEKLVLPFIFSNVDYSITKVQFY
jgi:hypothetical protein